MTELIKVPFICHPLTSQLVDLCVSKYQHLSGLDLADPPSTEAVMEVDILIGSDYYWNFTTGAIRRGDNGPVAIHTSLGWVLSGMISASADQDSSLSFLVTHTLRTDAVNPTENLDEVLRSFWDLEALGINATEESVLN